MVKKEKKSSTLGIISIVLGVISFIPLIGFFIGFVAGGLGIVDMKKNKSKLGLIGLILGIVGILITVILYGSLFYFGFVQRGGVYDDLRATMVEETQLPNTINAIESYKARFGSYPEKIEDLEKVSTDPWIAIDQLQAANLKAEDKTFYYETTGDTYYLFSRGPDGVPFTDDDVFPKFTGDIGNIGYTEPQP